MRTLIHSFIPASLLAAVASACTPYDPELGAAPFKCGPIEQAQRCPNGYTCIPQQGSNAPEVCIQNGGDGKIPDGGNGVCDDDRSLEPNDTKEMAWITPVDNTTSFPLSSLSICPAGDKDTYSVMMSVAMRNLEMIVEYEAGGADLQGAILNSSGIAIANATLTTTNIKRAYTPNLPIGIYYVQVTGPVGGTLTTNNYKLNINVTGP
jgi:hypothetical protein